MIRILPPAAIAGVSVQRVLSILFVTGPHRSRRYHHRHRRLLKGGKDEEEEPSG